MKLRVCRKGLVPIELIAKMEWMPLLFSLTFTLCALKARLLIYSDFLSRVFFIWLNVAAVVHVVFPYFFGFTPFKTINHNLIELALLALLVIYDLIRGRHRTYMIQTDAANAYFYLVQPFISASGNFFTSYSPERFENPVQFLFLISLTFMAMVQILISIYIFHLKMSLAAKEKILQINALHFEGNMHLINQTIESMSQKLRAIEAAEAQLIPMDHYENQLSASRIRLFSNEIEIATVLAHSRYLSFLQPSWVTLNRTNLEPASLALFFQELLHWSSKNPHFEKVTLCDDPFSPGSWHLQVKGTDALYSILVGLAKNNGFKVCSSFPHFNLSCYDAINLLNYYCSKHQLAFQLLVTERENCMLQIQTNLTR